MSNELCVYKPSSGGRWQCDVCGHVSLAGYASPPFRKCVTNDPSKSADARHVRSVSQALEAANVEPQSLGLGDMTAAALSAVGITKERWSEWWGGDCGCNERQEKLNKVGQTIAGFLRGHGCPDAVKPTTSAQP